MISGIDTGKELDKTNFSLVCCGLRYGKTKLQAEQIKQMLEEYKIENLSIHIIDSETKDRINKAIGHINVCGCELSKDETKYLLKILKGE